MQKIKIGIDLDITLFNTDIHWLKWLMLKPNKGFNRKQYISDSNNNNVEYNLTKYFEGISSEEGFKYWSDPNTYKSCDIHEGAKDVIRNLYEANCEIIFISYCMNCPDQIKYKLKRLKEEFDFMLPEDFNFIPAKKKHLVKCDLLVDDRNSFLQEMDDSVKLIKWESPYIQEVELDKPHTVCKTWVDVETIICDWMEEYYES
ncbi:hypothetical protein [Vibrio phage vB_VibM_10AMN]|uniref:Nucleotidase n=1 Tax=Staphylococcus phage vB_VibM_10AMN12 TaxID=3076785 RepID=A0AA96R6N7_9CAUD|nr:hypothetical protein [Vibrio phage vB_VibM_10AMN]WNO47532.1 hypothetical protein [Staphylococcus phage vB_VibM_10AMN12]